MSQSTTPPLDPFLIPDSPADQDRKLEATPGRDLAAVKRVATIPAPASEKKRHTQKPEPPRYTLEDAFDYFSMAPGGESNDSEFQNERCVRAVTFLLHYLSEHGNEDVDGFAAHGLGHVLEKCAGNIAHAVAHREWLRKTESSERQNP